MGLFLRAGATAYDALAGITKDTYKALTKPGAKMLNSDNQFIKAIGAFWISIFGVLLPLFILKCIFGFALTGDPFFAWRD